MEKKKPNLSSEKYQIPVNYEGDNLRKTVSDESVEHQKWGNGEEKDAKVLDKKFGEAARVDHVRPETDKEYADRLKQQGVEDGLSKREAAAVAKKTVAMEDEMFERTSGSRARREQIVALQKGMEADLAENDAALEAGTLTQMEHDQKAKEIQDNAENKIRLLEKARDRQKEKYVADTYANADSSEFYDEANTIASAEDAAAYERWAAKQDEEEEKLGWAAEQNPESASKSKIDRVEASAKRHAERIANTKTEAEIAASEEAILNNLERHYHHKHDIDANNIAQPVSTEAGRHLSHEDLKRETERVKERAQRERDQIEQFFAEQADKDSKDDNVESAGDTADAAAEATAEDAGVERNEDDVLRNVDALAEAHRTGEKERTEEDIFAQVDINAKAHRDGEKVEDGKQEVEEQAEAATEDKAEKKSSKSEAFLQRQGLLKDAVKEYARDIFYVDPKNNGDLIKPYENDFAFFEEQETDENKSQNMGDVYKAASTGTLERLIAVLQSAAEKCKTRSKELMEIQKQNGSLSEAESAENSELKQKQSSYAGELVEIEKERNRRQAKDTVDATFAQQAAEARAEETGEGQENNPDWQRLFGRMEMALEMLEEAYRTPGMDLEELKRIRDRAMEARRAYADQFARLGNNIVEARILEISNSIDNGEVL